MPRSLPPLLCLGLVVALGCESDKSNTAPDSDGDGSPDAEDCSPDDPAVHPGAEEVCDGLDTDCDGALDPDEADEDGDGFPACAECDDDNPDIHPEAEERCDDADVDEDCDGLSDDADDDAVGKLTAYLDADGDGWGDAATPSDWCDPPADHSTLPGDCLDSNPDVWPGASEGDFFGPDWSCDGVPARGSVDDAALLVRGNDAHSLVGWALASAGDVDGDGRDDLLVSAAGFPGDYGVGAARLLRGTRTDAGGVVDIDSAAILFEHDIDGALFGNVVAGLGDVDGDGLDDVLVGSSWGNAAYLFPGSMLAEDGPIASSDAVVFEGTWEDDGRAGSCVAALGDVNGDGLQDWLTGGGRYRGSRGDGRMAVMLGDSTLAPGARLGWGDAAYTLEAPRGEEVSGACGGVDVDGDGLHDVLTVDVFGDRGLLRPGAELDRLGSATPLAMEGGEVQPACPGDLNGDGYGDVALGAPYQWSDDYSGAVGVFFGPELTDAPGSLGAPLRFLEGSGRNLGASVSGAGDVDRDGRAELLVSNGSDWPKVFLINGDLLEETGVVELEGRAVEVSLSGDSPNVAAAGDVDGDGADDFLVGVFVDHYGAAAVFLSAW